MSTSTNTQKQLEKLAASVAAGQYYEAQQMYKTTFYRCKARKQVDDSYQILKQGAIEQFRNGQITCGVELARLLLETYTKDQVACNSETLANIMAIIEAFPQPSGSATELDPAVVQECVRVVTSALKWAQAAGSDAEVRKLHDALGNFLWCGCGAEQLGRIQLQYIRGSDAQAFAEVLHACAADGEPGEGDLFATRAVLQALAAARQQNKEQQLQHAAAIATACRSVGLLGESPLSNFCTLLLDALKRGSLQLVRMLQDAYRPSLLRDETLAAYLSKVEQQFFNVQKSSGGLGGLLGNFLNMLSEEGGDDDA